MDIKCHSCGRTTSVPQKYPYHAGFSNCGFLYCDSASAILKFDSYNPRYTAIVGDKHPWSLKPDEKKRVEDSLKPHETGGRFRFNALPRCPVCNASLPDLLKDEFHFVEIGHVVDADREDAWVEQKRTNTSGLDS
jgi:hypothetical protein